ncbi:Transcriptional regulator, AraC family [Azospirillum endophyticum]
MMPDHAVPQGKISPGFVEDALDCLRRRGIDPAEALAVSGISPSVTDWVSNVQYGALWTKIAALLQDEFFGLGSRPMRPGSFALLCHAVLHAKTLEQVLQRALKFLEIILDDPAGDLVQCQGRAEIVLRDLQATHSAFACRTYWLILLSILCWLSGRRIALLQVDFSCAAPENRLDYRRFFGVPVQFDRPRNRIAFSAAYLSLPCIRDERALADFLREMPANILLRHRHDQRMSALIRDRLRKTLPGEWPDFDDIAADFRLSPATLRRRLRREGQNFIAIRDEIRYEQAQAILCNRTCSISEVSEILGYAEPSAFHRAFLKWSGLTPSVFREEVRQSTTAASGSR